MGTINSTQGIVNEIVRQRFWSKVQRCEHGASCRKCCWVWTGALKPNGYGHFAYRIEGRRLQQSGAHRMSWMFTYGDILPGIWVLHNCPTGDNPACVNPQHLWLGTSKDNTQDALKKGSFYRTQHKLSDHQIYDIRYLACHGMPIRLIGHLYGVTKQNISNILHGRNWKHLPLIVEER